MKVKFLSVAALVSVGLVAGCSSSTIESVGSYESSSSNHLSSEKAEISSNETKHHEQLDYSKQDDWGFESGAAQSPIDIVTAKAEAMKDAGTLELDYQNQVIDEVDNGHSIQVDSGGTSTINGRNYELNQFHFHAVSEHTLDGQHFPIEVHFVNQAQDGRLAVIAVFSKKDKLTQALTVF